MGDSFVEEGNLAVNARRLRKALAVRKFGDNK
jgi:hypothetical protein